MQRVIIADDRPKWMVREDNMMICFTRCSFYKHCSSRMGADCKHLGGDMIPKVGGRHGKQGKAKAAVKKGN
ncbi:hypothetical protein J1P26_07355 [Neobacillus sp. MM2021_6]|uniref:hypothetical protein n=1 Tax=Bacillaceae TaxID=186817 RepID=UPI0014080664|nr:MULTISPECIES: hypothetical protein [Bacillaceae]MBO0959549.1 hypothetical protein [Neobacillus sp. MM2021_6]NHC17153.1 hypothetical protein [Bacillus sp. MM2020_4]